MPKTFRYYKGTREGGLKAAQKNLKNNPNFYREIGRRGGQNGHTGGFAANPELAKLAGAKGGRSHRGRGPAKRDAQGRALRKDGTPYRSWPTGKDRAPRKANTKRATKDLDKLIAEIEKEEKPTLTYEEIKTQRKNLFLRFFRRNK